MKVRREVQRNKKENRDSAGRARRPGQAGGANTNPTDKKKAVICRPCENRL